MITYPRMVIGTEFLSRKKYSINYLKEYFKIALSHKFNEIDTAQSYGYNNLVEKTLGEVLGKNRKKYKIASKFLNILKNNKFVSINSLDDIKLSVETTLNNLKTDYIDIFYFHSGSNNQFFNDKLWNYLNDLKTQNIIKSLGLSFKNDLILNNSLEQISNLKEYGISKVQIVFNMLSDSAKFKILPSLKKMNVEIYGRMPYAKGYLINNYIFEKSSIELKNEFTEKHMYENILYIKKNYKTLNKSEVIKYALLHVNKVVLASSSVEQLKENIEVLETHA
tara:strand:- start:207 stop:1043 length:837 start_codon:yes stop_codon:yes gene_type:complete